MKIASAFAIGWIALCGTTVPVLAAEDMHKLVTPGDVKWGPGPKVLPPGAQAAVLFGDPAKEGLFALRLKLPPGYAVPPHTHPVDEVVTVVSGTFNLGMGETADDGSLTALPAGSFFALAPGTPHYAHVDDEAVIQITTMGPWGIKYVNPADDPRKTQ